MVAQNDALLFCKVCTEERGIDTETLKQTIRLAVEIAREGREGRKIGTMFVVSDTDQTLQQSTCLILVSSWATLRSGNGLTIPTCERRSRNWPSWTARFL